METMTRLFKLLELSDKASVELSSNVNKNNAEKCEKFTQLTIDELKKQINVLKLQKG